MKKFEEEFNYLIELSGKVLTGQIEVEKFENQRAIFLNKYAEKHQPEIPEVPQFVADWYEENKSYLEYRIWKYIRCWNDHEKDDFYDFMNGAHSNPIETLINMKNGYTVAKEKRFYLKFNKQLFNPENGNTVYSDLYLDDEGALITDKNYAKQFSQQEIDSMDTGSYEQILVEEEA